MVSAQEPAVFVCAGSDAHSRESAVASLVSKLLAGGSRDCDLQTFRGADAQAREVLDHLATIPFLAPRRLAIVRSAEELPDKDLDALIAFARKPSPHACLILDSDDPAFAKRFRGMKTVKTRLFSEPAGADRAAWVRQYVASRGKKIEPAAALFVREACPGDLAGLAQELEKVITYVGDRDVIRADDAEGLVGRSLVTSAFDLTNAIEANKVDDALRVVGELLRSGKRHYEIIGLLAWHVKRLLRAKTLQRKGGTEAYIASTMNVNRRYFGRFFAQVRALRIDAIRSQMRVLLEADLDIKRSRLDPALALECAVLRLCLRGC